MLYCALTGESAVGQDYSFCSNGNLNDRFDFNAYIKSYYLKDTTNFPEIFNTPSDMLGIQEIIDEYLETKPYRNYNFE